MNDEEKKAAEEYAKQQARLVWDNWIESSTDDVKISWESSEDEDTV